MNGLGGSGGRSLRIRDLIFKEDEQSASDFGCLSQGNSAFDIPLIRSVLIMKDVGMKVTTEVNMTSFVISDCYQKSSSFRCHFFYLIPWGRFLTEKLIIAQMAGKVTFSFKNISFLTFLLEPTPVQILRILTLYFLKTFIIFLLFTAKSPTMSLPFNFWN
jgi:hypothetical protein